MSEPHSERDGGLIVGLHHAQITIPPGMEAAARAFYCDLLRLSEIEKPESLKANGGFWVQVGANELHIGIEAADVRAQTKAHVAFESVDLPAIRRGLSEMGIAVSDAIPIPGFERFEVRDPFGNRLEFITRIRSNGPA